MYHLKVKKLDVLGDKASLEVILHSKFASKIGAREGDLIDISYYYRDLDLGAIVRLTDTLINEDEIGLYQDIWEKYKIENDALVNIELKGQSKSIEYIKKKILGQELNYDEIYELMNDIGDYKLTPIEMTYFASASFSPGFNEQENYFLTKAMAETGQILNFPNDKKMVLDKHSIGGLPSKGVTPIITALLASLGFTIPNTTSRSITSPAGTADVLETIIPVCLTEQKIKEVVSKTNGCLVWGGALDLAPADDILIQIEKPLHIESYEQFITSIIAKKVAMGITHLLIDMPTGIGTKVPIKDSEMVADKFQKLCLKFNIKVDVYTREGRGPDGRGIGPILEAKDFLRVLERHSERPIELENLALDMAARLLVLADHLDYSHAIMKLREQLDNKQALAKFWQIGFAQGGTQIVNSDTLQPGEFTFEIQATQDGVISRFDSLKIIQLTRALGTPYAQKSGMYLYKVIGDRVQKGEVIAIAYAEKQNRQDMAEKIYEEIKEKIVMYR